MAEKIYVTTPVGRIVMGDLYKPNTTDAEGRPLVYKTGANVGQPRVNFFFALAISKGEEPHWAHTPWGNPIWNVGNAAFPQAAQSPDFSWKIIDGDSQAPGKLWKGKPGKKPCENEGFPGHWVLKFSGSFAPIIYLPDATAVSGYTQITEPGYLKPGYYAQVAFNVEGNQSQSNPGVYLNFAMICFSAKGIDINFGPDVAEAGFGNAPLPAGAILTPPDASIPLPFGGPIPVLPNTGFVQLPPPNLPNGLPLPNTGTFPAPAGVAQPTTTVIPASPSNIPLPPSPPAPVGPRMTAKAAGATREAFIAAGWNDANLIAQGYMTM